MVFSPGLVDVSSGSPKEDSGKGAWHVVGVVPLAAVGFSSRAGSDGGGRGCCRGGGGGDWHWHWHWSTPGDDDGGDKGSTLGGIGIDNAVVLPVADDGGDVHGVSATYSVGGWDEGSGDASLMAATSSASAGLGTTAATEGAYVAGAAGALCSSGVGSSSASYLRGTNRGGGEAQDDVRCLGYHTVCVFAVAFGCVCVCVPAVKPPCK